MSKQGGREVSAAQYDEQGERSSRDLPDRFCSAVLV